MSDEALSALASKAGIALSWTANDGIERAVSIATQRAVLDALGLGHGCASDMRDSARRLEQRRRRERLPPLVTARMGEPIRLPIALPERARAHIEYDNGIRQDVTLCEAPDGAALAPALQRPGFHRIACNGHSATLAVAPQRCWTFADAGQGRKLWGLAAQTYGLFRDGAGRAGKLEAGTLADAGLLAAHAAALGADGLMLSPAHALFAADSKHFSPYSPSSRFFYNALLCDPADAFGGGRVGAVAASLSGDDTRAALQENQLIDWPGVAQAKYALLRALFESAQVREFADPANPLRKSFDLFKAAGGKRLADHALFETLHQSLFSADPSCWSWTKWPEGLRSPDQPQAKSFARENACAIDYHMFLQWLTLRSFSAAQANARNAGMAVGLIGDLAIGVSAGGSHSWSMPGDLVSGLSIGAPPDALAPRGQNWGLTTFSPLALEDSGFETFLATLRATLGPAGGVRIDHVMGLMRLWLIPEGGDAGDGAYVAFPFEDLLRLIALESFLTRKAVIGEDLGTLPTGIRQNLEQAGLAGLRVLLFEKNGGMFRPPAHYSAAAVTMTTTHDTPTLKGWQRGLDIDLRAPLDQLPPGQTPDGAHREREADLDSLRHMLSATGLSQPEVSHFTREERERQFTAAAIAFAALSPSHFTVVPLEDMCGAVEQPNLPGTTIEHPNWRRRYDRPVETMLEAEPAASHVQILQRMRPQGKQAAE